MATVSTVKISPNFDERNRARLESKTYTRAWTEVPNKALPETYKVGLGAVYKALTGEDFDLDGYTFTVRADSNGVFKRLYSPAIFATEGGDLIVRWGDRDIPLSVAPGKIGTPSAVKGTKFSIKEEQNGKFSDPVLSVSTSFDGTLYTFPIPIRSADIENKATAETLELILDENPTELAKLVQIAPDPSKRSEGGGERLQGPFMKVSQLPVDTYKVTTYRAKEGGQFGTKYYLQVQLNEPFVAEVREQVDGEWQTVEREVSDWAIVEPNTAIKKVLAADPVIDAANPAVLTVLGHGEYNGRATAKCTFQCSAFSDSPDSFDIGF